MLYLYINNSVNQVVMVLKIANIPVLTGSAAALFEKKMRPSLGTWVVEIGEKRIVGGELVAKRSICYILCFLCQFIHK